MPAVACTTDPGFDHPMLRALEFLGRPCRVYQKDDTRPYLEGTVESLGVTKHGEFFLLVRPSAVQIEDMMTTKTESLQSQTSAIQLITSWKILKKK